MTWSDHYDSSQASLNNQCSELWFCRSPAQPQPGGREDLMKREQGPWGCFFTTFSHLPRWTFLCSSVPVLLSFLCSFLTIYLLSTSYSLCLIWAALVGLLTRTVLIGSQQHGDVQSVPMENFPHSCKEQAPTTSPLVSGPQSRCPRRLIKKVLKEQKIQNFLQRQSTASGGVSWQEVGPDPSLRLMH